MPLTYRCRCENPDCGKQFTANRKDAKFCSAVCRKQASRVTDNVTDNVGSTNDEGTITDISDAIRDTPRSTRQTRKAATSTNTEQGDTAPPAGNIKTDHTHCNVHPHQHPEGRTQCSGRYYCNTCHAWFSGPPCEGMTIPSVLARLHNPGLGPR